MRTTKIVAPRACATTVDQAAPATPQRGKPPRPKIQSASSTMSARVETTFTTSTTRVWPRPAKKVASVAISTTGKAPRRRMVANVISLRCTAGSCPASANTGPTSGETDAMSTPAPTAK